MQKRIMMAGKTGCCPLVFPMLQVMRKLFELELPPALRESYVQCCIWGTIILICCIDATTEELSPIYMETTFAICFNLLVVTSRNIFEMLSYGVFLILFLNSWPPIQPIILNVLGVTSLIISLIRLGWGVIQAIIATSR